MSGARPLMRVINCAKHKKRLRSFRRAASKAVATQPIVRKPRVNGATYTDADLCEMVDEGIVDKNADLSPIEVAIARSHRKCWEELVQSTSTYMVVCEDDAVLQTTSFEPFLRALLSSQGRRNKFRFDIFYFVNGNWEKTKTRAKYVGALNGVKIFKEHSEHYNAGLACYCIHRDYAEILCERQFPMKEPVDNFIGATLPRRKRHLFAETSKDDLSCYTQSAVASMNCPVEGSELSTQDRTRASIKDRRCDKRTKQKRTKKKKKNDVT